MLIVIVGMVDSYDQWPVFLTKAARWTYGTTAGFYLRSCLRGDRVLLNQVFVGLSADTNGEGDDGKDIGRA